jgi:putative peptide zinc metalloprotease protein
MLPFVRMDGYWILADLTGIPDFFSQMGAFVRSLLGKQEGELPELKPWARVVFVLYTIIVVPLIALLVFLAIKGFPAIVATGLDSGAKLAAASGDGMARGDLLAIPAGILQILILALQVFGIGLVVFKVLRRVFVGLWKWGSDSPTRRVLSSAASLAIVALLVFLWAPVLPTGEPGPLYATSTANFSPIPETARGTIGDAVPAVNAVVPPALREPAPTAAPGESAPPASSPSVAPTAAPTVIPFSTPTPAPSTAPSPSGTP